MHLTEPWWRGTASGDSGTDGALIRRLPPPAPVLEVVPDAAEVPSARWPEGSFPLCVKVGGMAMGTQAVAF